MTNLLMLEINIRDHILLKKKHPCGGREWEVWRVGMDIGLKCLTCGRKMRLLRSELQKHIKKVLI
ncbi:DUF951 family protein [Candidatus Poribacteria bacterium]|nr:DUF951 family protein [Candidatus Poribacteria bacterium]